MEQKVTNDGTILEEKQEGCTVSLLTEPSVEWMNANQPATEPIPQPPTLEEQLKMTQSAVDFILMNAF